VQEDEELNPYITETAVANDGSVIVWETAKSTEYITVTSLRNGWVTSDQAETLKDWYKNATTLTIEFTDSTTVDVSPAHEKRVDIKPIREGGEMYRIVFPTRRDI
jgi:predicted Zn-dependent protease